MYEYVHKTFSNVNEIWCVYSAKVHGGESIESIRPVYKPNLFLSVIKRVSSNRESECSNV